MQELLKGAGIREPHKIIFHPLEGVARERILRLARQNPHGENDVYVVTRGGGPLTGPEKGLLRDKVLRALRDEGFSLSFFEADQPEPGHRFVPHVIVEGGQAQRALLRKRIGDLLGVVSK